MNYEFVKNALRRHLQSETVYRYARRALLLYQYASRTPDEVDYRVLRNWPARDHRLVVDIGANGGQSAIAFGFLLPNHNIVSFEPNPQLWSELDFVGRVLGRRFRYETFGLGSEAGEMMLHVPYISELPVTTRASLDRDAAEAQAASLRRETGQEVSLRTRSVAIRTFDSLSLRPDIVKIDVEGFELDVLRGMERTLIGCRPLILAESNAGDEACFALLGAIDYRILGYDQTTGALSETPAQSTRNWFGVPAECLADFAGPIR